MMLRNLVQALCIMCLMETVFPASRLGFCRFIRCGRRICPCLASTKVPTCGSVTNKFPSSTPSVSSSSSTNVVSTSSTTVDRTISTKTLEQSPQTSSKSQVFTTSSKASTTSSKTPRIYTPATTCDPLSCRLPSCRCAGTDIPGGFQKSNTPQIILLTMDDGVGLENIQLYRDLLNGLTNFNGCPVKATFFVSGDNTDYSLVKELQLRGHEIADHSVTHKFPIEWWNQNPSYTDLEFEIVGQMKTIQETVNTTTRGWRNPFLESTENTFRVLADNNFLYDTTLSTFPGVRWWPYTLDHLTSTECYMSNCPKNSYPGLWEVPLVHWQCDQAGVNFGIMIDECQDSGDEESVYQMIMRNFMIHYQDNKQPFPMFTHSFWFDNANYRKTALIRFINDVRKLNDVYFVTVQQAVQWMQSPIGQDKSPFSCR